MTDEPSAGVWMRTLVIAGEYPWPVNSGSRLRLVTVLRGLRRCGPVELFSVIPDGRPDIDPPDDALGLDRVGRTGFDDRPPSGAGWLRALTRASNPLEFPDHDGPAVARELARFAHGRYDLIWYFGVRPWVLVGGVEGAPFVLDVVDLEDHKIAARLSVPRPGGTGGLAPVRRRAAEALSHEEMRRWHRLQRRASAAAAATVVCSDQDASRAVADGLARVEVVRNGYRRVDRPVGKVDVEDPPTVLFQGTLRYPPNAEGARYLVDQVRPELVALVPDVRIRLVGVSTPALEALDSPPGVTVVGRVPDIDEELALADLVVVPIRFGSGTRLKILEAFAQRIPVVSTTLGAEGLGAVDGTHLLLADDPGPMAEACARLLSDRALRAEVTEAAHRLFLERFDEDLVEQQVAAVARRVDPGTGPDGPHRDGSHGNGPDGPGSGADVG